MPRERPIPLRGGEEFDRLTGWKRFQRGGRQRARKAKKQYRQRLRRKERQEDRRTEE